MANTGDAPALPGSGYQLMPVPPGRVAAVVTYLEMRRPPADLHPLRPPPAGWSIRRVTDPGLDWYRGLFRRIGGDLLWYSRLVMADDALAAILRDPAIEIHVLLVDGREEGLLELDRRQPPDVELAFFGLAPTMVGRGAGGFLMRHALAKAWGAGDPGMSRVWVHTCTLDHPNALGFYRRMGFTPYRQALELADDPRLAGALPEDAAPQVPIFRP